MRIKRKAEEARKAGSAGVDKARAAEIARLEKEVDQRHWKGDFQQLALGATGVSPPAVDLLADAILTELGY